MLGSIGKVELQAKDGACEGLGIRGHTMREGSGFWISRLIAESTGFGRYGILRFGAWNLQASGILRIRDSCKFGSYAGCSN